jgi:hypothetical protein
VTQSDQFIREIRKQFARFRHKAAAALQYSLKKPVLTACVVKNALALFVRNDASKQRVVGANTKDVKVVKVVKKGENRDMRSANAAGVLESNYEYLAAA